MDRYILRWYSMGDLLEVGSRLMTGNHMQNRGEVKGKMENMRGNRGKDRRSVTKSPQECRSPDTPRITRSRDICYAISSIRFKFPVQSIHLPVFIDKPKFAKYIG